MSASEPSPSEPTVGSTSAEPPGAGPGAAVDRGPRRLHPTSLLFNIGGFGFSLLLPGLLVIFFAVGDREDAWFMWAFVPAVLASVFRYLTLRYELCDGELVVREGLIFRATRHIPYARIQNVDTVQNPFHRLLSVAVVRIETAAGKEPEAVLQVLSMREVEEIRRGIAAGRSSQARAGEPGGSAERAASAEPELPSEDAQPEASAKPFFRMRAGDVLLFGLLSQRGLAYLSGAAYLAWEFSLFERFEERLGVDLEEWLVGAVDRFALPGLLVWSVLGLVFLGVLQVLTTVWAFVTLHGFALSRDGDDLRSVCGLWTHQTATLPRRRIQRLTLHEGWFLRRLGRGSLRVTTAGADSTDGKQITRRWLVPVAPRAALLEVLRDVQPEVDFEDEHWEPIHPRAWRRLFKRLGFLGLLAEVPLVLNFGALALLTYPLWLVLALSLARTRSRRLGWRVTGQAVLVRDGWISIERTAVRFAKVQSVALTRNPFDRRHGMATVRIATAGGSATSGGVVVPYLPLREARRLARRLTREAAAVEFRW